MVVLIVVVMEVVQRQMIGKGNQDVTDAGQAGVVVEVVVLVFGVKWDMT